MILHHFTILVLQCYKSDLLPGGKLLLIFLGFFTLSHFFQYIDIFVNYDLIIISLSAIILSLLVLETPSLLIVSTGYGNGGRLKSTEVLNLGNEMTPSFQDNLKSLNGATGGWVGNGFIVCGGYVDGEGYSKECHKIGKEETVKIGDMIMKRRYAASIVEGERIWILGGYGDSNSKTTSEFFSVNDGSSEQGPDLPIGLYRHTATKINTTTSIVIGGYTGSYYSAKTFFYSHQIGQWINGPDLIQGRYDHSACFVTDSVTQESFIVVTGGYDGSVRLDSVEILDKYGTVWTSGKLL